MANKPVILCVDDERNIVDSMRLNLRKHYEVLTALSGSAGLDALREQPEVAVVISDMRMPEMDGATFLAEVKAIAPSVVRMLLTGYSDIEAAMRAVNEGQIFRFLTKPCAPDHLLTTLQAGVEQHRLITAERVLLQKTLLGCVKALVDVLALSNPMALGRAVRIRNKARKLAKRLRIEQIWRIEFAALLSQLGAVSLPDETVRKLYDGDELDPHEHGKLVENMATMNRILGNIPRLEPVTGLLDELRALTDGNAQLSSESRVSLEARLLYASIELDSMEGRGQPLSESLKGFQQSASTYGEDLLDALMGLKNDPEQMQMASIELKDLEDGMVLCDDLKTSDGVLILPRGFAVNAGSREHVFNFADRLEGLRIKVLTSKDTAAD